MFIFIIWIRLEACLFLGRRVSILSIQKCSVPSSCKSSCSAFHPYCKNFIVLRSHHDSEIEFVFDEFGAWSSNYIIRRWTELEKGFELVAALCISADDGSCLQAPRCALPLLMMLQLHQPARNTLSSAEHRHLSDGELKVKQGQPCRCIFYKSVSDNSLCNI